MFVRSRCLFLCSRGGSGIGVLAPNGIHIQRSKAGKYGAATIIYFRILEFIRFRKIVIRLSLLKPDVLLQESGHIVLSDFDLAKNDVCGHPTLQKGSKRGAVSIRRLRFQTVVMMSNTHSYLWQYPRLNTRSCVQTLRTNSFVGTEEYIAPEIVVGQYHDSAVDWWTLGIFVYEMIVSWRFSRHCVLKSTRKGKLTLTPSSMRQHHSKVAVDRRHFITYYWHPCGFLGRLLYHWQANFNQNLKPFLQIANRFWKAYWTRMHDVGWDTELVREMFVLTNGFVISILHCLEILRLLCNPNVVTTQMSRWEVAWIGVMPCMVKSIGAPATSLIRLTNFAPVRKHQGTFVFARFGVVTD
jgi:hypothetical protein